MKAAEMMFDLYFISASQSAINQSLFVAGNETHISM